MKFLRCDAGADEDQDLREGSVAYICAIARWVSVPVVQYLVRVLY